MVKPRRAEAKSVRLKENRTELVMRYKMMNFITQIERCQKVSCNHPFSDRIFFVCFSLSVFKSKKAFLPQTSPILLTLTVFHEAVFLSLKSSHFSDDLSGGLWEDEDTRQFYESLPELKTILPGILFKESEQATLAPVSDNIEDVVIEEETAASGETAATKEVKYGELISSA